MDQRILNIKYLEENKYGLLKKNKKYTKKQLQKYIKINRIKNMRFCKKRSNTNIGI